jgi:hypothetical protein
MMFGIEILRLENCSVLTLAYIYIMELHFYVTPFL